MMQKILVIVVNNYPYGYGESFLKDELDELSKSFDRILLVIPMGLEIVNGKNIFTLPNNVFVVPIDNKYTWWQKIITPFRIGPFALIKLIQEEKKVAGGKFSFPMLKVLLAYLAKERSFRVRLWKVLKKREFVQQNLVLYSYWFTEYTYSLFKLKKKHPGIKVYTRTHGWDIYSERHNPPYLPLRKPIIEGIDGTFTVSDQGRNYLLSKLGLPVTKVETFRLGVKEIPLISFKPDKDCINILSVSFIVPIKHLEILIEALAKIDIGIQINWFHIGGGEQYATQITDLAEKELGKKAKINYRFKGTLSNAEIISFVSTQPIDLFFNVSRDEGLPVSMMEAISAGIPIVGPQVGGIPEIIDHGSNGFLLSEKPSATEIIEVIQHYSRLSEEEIQKLRTHAYETWNTRFNAAFNHGKFAKRLLAGIGKEYYECSRCILTSKDYPDIVLDENGICNVCMAYDKLAKTHLVKDDGNAIKDLLEKIKSRGKGKQYDCLIGVSGGVDSSYVLYLAKTWGLRPLVLHVDTGWNSTSAVENIKHLVKKLEFDLHTIVVDWTELKDLQLAFLKASVVDIDLPVDNIIIAASYGMARKFGIKYILTGENLATEGWLPPNFNHNKNDVINIRDIHQKYGLKKIKKVPLVGFADLYRARKIFGIHWVAPLNYINFDPEMAKSLLSEKLDWKDYGLKHSENLFTRFYQSYILPEKFKIHKNRAHLSTRICSGQLTRSQALIESENLAYDEETLKNDRSFFIKKLDLTEAEFDQIIHSEPLPHSYYRSFITTLQRLRPLTRIIRKIGLLK